jgi:hypothetical protein
MNIEFKECAGKQLTVAELREWLAEVPSESLVTSEGCDCEDEATGIRITTDERGAVEVMIARHT